ncbi:MAG: DNA mismatch repair protein MutS, partial [Actinobacteria bacterium]|nr:DNA mismatch repair protein MutS [Actinomycetota bacterium]
SAGLTRFRDYLAGYTESAQFALLAKQTEQLQGELSSVKYCVIIKDNSVGVRKYESELDYSAMVEDTFARFQEGAAKDYRVKFPENRSMNHVEAQILDRVARLYPEVFSRLDEYTSQNRDYLDEKVAAFDREIQFYVAYLEHVGRLERAGLEFCLPEVTRASKQIYAQQAFDLALAHKLVGEGAKVVRNDFHLAGRERIIVVTGPNQGGKTTFARAFGQLHYLAGLGLPVPARKARLFLFDRLFTHFEREERVRNLRGKLHDDLVRLRDILDHVTSDSIVIMNEPFASTTVSDAVFLGGKVMGALDKLDVLGVIVTFLDELTSMSDKAVSMVSMIAPEDPAVRSTYEIVRKPADGRAYALAIARKYRLTYDALKERLG